MNMAEIAIIIGNGFDLDLGLPSKYSQFIESDEWKKIAKIPLGYVGDDNYKKQSLICYLQEKAYDKENWFDIEEEIHNFVLNHTKCSERDVENIKREFDKLKSALSDYLIRVSRKLEHKADKSRLAYQFLYNLQNSPYSKIEILFNYTVPDLFLEMPTYHEIGKGFFTYVHGSLRNNDIVLGCDVQEGEKVNRSLSFMYKYNMLNRANHVARHILGAKEVVFFGHSVNEMDFGYFREFFKAASAAPEPVRHLTIITFDENSERNIKDNIRNQGISVTDLYNNLWTFDFIHTKKIYANDESEIKKWDEMMRRLMTKEHRGVKVRT